jgi:hypothetical protein
MTSIPPPHNSLRLAGVRGATSRARGASPQLRTREITPRSRRIVGAVLLVALVVMLFFGVLAWIDYFATHPA